MAMVNKQTTLSRQAMLLVRLLIIAQLQSDFRVKAQYIPSKDNCVADTLSHFQDDRFQREAPNADSFPTLPPTFLSPPSECIWKDSYF